MQRPSKPKFSVQAKLMDFTSKVRHVVESTPCMKHEASIGKPCWWIHGDGSLTLYAAVCNSRAKKIYTGNVTERSRSGRPKKEHR